VRQDVLCINPIPQSFGEGLASAPPTHLMWISLVPQNSPYELVFLNAFQDEDTVC